MLSQMEYNILIITTPTSGYYIPASGGCRRWGMCKRFFIIFLILGSVIVTSCSKDPVESQSQEKHSIVILFENDVHCAIDGYPKIAGLRDAIADTAWAALVSSGDYIQGNNPVTISRGQYIIDIMRSMHYDAVGLGNHEFDFNTPRLLEIFAGFNAPVVCCNFTDMQGHCVFAPYVVRNYGGSNVAFVGVLTPQTELESEPYAFVDMNGNHIYTLHEQEYTALVQQSVDAARAEGADYVILLSHMGEVFDGNVWTSNDLIAATHGIDAVLDAHTHNVIDTVIQNSLGQPVLLANTGTQFANIGKLWIGADGRMDITLIPMEQVTEISPSVDAVVQQVNRQVQEQTGQVVAHSDVNFVFSDTEGNRLARMQETNAGDLVTDALRWFAQADIGLVNGGAIRAAMAAGDVTYGDVIRMVPFDNPVVKIQATGAQILEMLRQCTATLPAEYGDFPQVSGLRYTVTVSDHSVSNVEVQQADSSYAPLDATSIYTVAVTDYAVSVDGFHGTLATCPIVMRTPSPGHEVVREYLITALGGNIGIEYSNPEGRITIIE